MLFIQKIVIYYSGKERSSEYARERESLKFLPLQRSLRIMPDSEVLMHSVDMHQYDSRMVVKNEQVQQFGREVFGEGTRSEPWYHKRMFENIRLFKNDGRYRIMFCDDFYYSIFSRTRRRGHNEAYNKKGSPFRYTDRLNETAFRLGRNEYGRIYFNNCYVHPNTRNRTYARYVYNIINCENCREKLFFRKHPDFEYKDMKILR